MIYYSSSKEEKRPWILRAREASVEFKGKTTSEVNKSLPQTLIYISCGWESFKEVLLQLLTISQLTGIHPVFILLGADFLYL